MSMSFLITSLIVILIPGTGVIYTITSAFSGGRNKMLFAALGCTLGILPHMLASILGLSLIMHFSAGVFVYIKWIGAVYLVYLGIGMILKKNNIDFSEHDIIYSNRKVVIKGLLINILNPKLTIFFLSFLPQFVSTTGVEAQIHMLTLGFVFMMLTYIVFVIYGMFANMLRTQVKKSTKIIDIIMKGFGGVLIYFAAKLALSTE